jgi:hypothetical protein
LGVSGRFFGRTTRRSRRAAVRGIRPGNTPERPAPERRRIPQRAAREERVGRPVRRAEGPAVRHAVGPSEAGPGGGPPRVAAHRRLREIRSARAARVHQVSPAHRAGRAVLQGHAGAASHGRAAHSLVSQPLAAGGGARAHASGHASGHQARARRAGAGVSFLARIRASAPRGGLLRVRLRALALRSWRGDVLARAVLLHLWVLRSRSVEGHVATRRSVGARRRRRRREKGQKRAFGTSR